MAPLWFSARSTPSAAHYILLGPRWAFPFLTGVRVSEQLGLLWEDIDLERNVLTIRRVQERDGSTTVQTKTEAGARDIPISATLRAMLLEWRLTVPRLDGVLYRVFPGPGMPQQWPLKRVGGGGPILYSNFLKRYWKPAFEAAGVRYVTHHSARHSFVSTLQACSLKYPRLLLFIRNFKFYNHHA